ncbi:unnamed protein product [Aphis gossypii]|uniref:Uncharacterized protein n=1 Tax=Aphis gossypii TaxID=80765 RepID=A0A9P0NE18_APHGO|nr:unnamed protein product [Aphis gossypii]
MQYNTHYCYASCRRALYKYTRIDCVGIYILVYWPLDGGVRGRDVTFVEHACDHYNNTLSIRIFMYYIVLRPMHIYNIKTLNEKRRISSCVCIYIFCNIPLRYSTLSPQYSALCRRANIVLTRLRRCFCCIISLLLLYTHDRPRVLLLLSI